MTSTQLAILATNLSTDLIKKISIYDLKTRLIILESLIDFLSGYQTSIEKTTHYNEVANQMKLFN